MASVTKFDHLKLVNNDEVEVGRLRKFTREVRGTPRVCEIEIEHESDGSCCRHEHWGDTMLRLCAIFQRGE
jgi:hypothetical protein